MKRRIRIILPLMILCILGINFSQGLWLYHSYRLNYQDLSREINNAMWEALRKLEIKEAGAAIGLSPGDSASGPVIQRFFFSDGDSATFLFAQRQEARLSPGDDSRVTRHLSVGVHPRGDSLMRLRRLAADTLATKISRMLILDRFFDREFNLARLDSIYAAELREKNIDMSYRLDTFRLESGPAFFFPREDKPPAAERELKSRPFPVNPLSRLFAQAVFPDTTPLLLRRMGGALLSSFALFVLTTGCLVYMLRTILTQKKLSEVKSDFINNMTHELKTPIATVSAALEAMQRFRALEDPVKARDYLEMSRQELHRLSGLVEKVLHIALEERRPLELHAEPTDVPALVARIIERQQLRLGSLANIRLESELDDPIARVDRTHFANAVSNLIDNAVKYSRADVDVRVRITRAEGFLHLSVKDNGIGIPKQYQRHIFEQFFRVPSGDVHNVKGFGLGLAYVKKIVDKHGGAVRVRSEVKRGSEFVISIPA